MVSSFKRGRLNHVHLFRPSGSSYRVCAAQDVPFGATYNGLLEPEGIALLFLILSARCSFILDKGPLRDT
jgi:hypothetical protein